MLSCTVPTTDGQEDETPLHLEKATGGRAKDRPSVNNPRLRTAPTCLGKNYLELVWGAVKFCSSSEEVSLQQ